MSEFQTGNLIYLVVLGAALIVMFIVNHRQGIGATLRQMISWCLIFLAVLAGYGLWEDVKRTVMPTQTVIASENRIVVPRSPDGHFYLTLDINERPVRFMVDTGASDLVLTREDAVKAGLDPDSFSYFGRARTANGEVRTAPVTLKSVALGPYVDRNVTASINDGDMGGSLLGMSYLDRWSRMEMGGGELVLTR
ncbi:MAG: TIGR02281 family clan AA aspartic protease [Rhodobacteraceae bacterium]|nr:TIGR02281 family clan AA aspartic protease [Paracoccaceae bacterium]MAY46513.1 TIGR02281 family clan AA aspartic protease [Paracoccaceae bacterium]QEW21127.1 clan AA aspartic protease [Marinibacterium anthonyi]|tara:strand:+ start:233 stop:814 length:582 start_codon:yes stop_codon:yes gene_type:complete